MKLFWLLIPCLATLCRISELCRTLSLSTAEKEDVYI